MRRKTTTLVLVALTVGTTSALTVCSTRRAGAEDVGVRWAAPDLAAALDEARASKRRVFVEFSAEWCPTCKQLEAEVLSTPDGGALTEKVVAVRLDFDDEANRPAVERYVVLSLPTVVVLERDGSQIGRIMGYEGREDWMAKAREAITATDPLPALRAAAKVAPDDAGAMLRLGKTLLVRGDAEGEGLLERVAWRRDAESADEAAEALFLLGRYLHRVKRDPDAARHVWRELGTRFPDSSWASGAWWWWARAQAELERPRVGLALLRDRARAAGDDVEPLVEWGEFMVKQGLADDRAAAREAIDDRLKRSVSDEQRRELESLRTKLAGE